MFTRWKRGRGMLKRVGSINHFIISKKSVVVTFQSLRFCSGHSNKIVVIIAFPKLILFSKICLYYHFYLSLIPRAHCTQILELNRYFICPNCQL